MNKNALTLISFLSLLLSAWIVAPAMADVYSDMDTAESDDDDADSAEGNAVDVLDTLEAEETTATNAGIPLTSNPSIGSTPWGPTNNYFKYSQWCNYMSAYRSAKGTGNIAKSNGDTADGNGDNEYSQGMAYFLNGDDADADDCFVLAIGYYSGSSSGAIYWYTTASSSYSTAYSNLVSGYNMWTNP